MRTILWLAVGVILATGHSLSAQNNPGSCKLDDSRFNSEEGGCLDLSTGLTWSLGPTAQMSYQVAEAYCLDLSEGRFNDWRLPELAELQAVAEKRRALDHFDFQTFSFFWTFSAGNSLDTRLIELASGTRMQAGKGNEAGRVVCVREPKDVDVDGIPDKTDQCNQTPPGYKGSELLHTVGKWKGCIGKDKLISAEDLHARAALGCKQESTQFATAEGGCMDLKSKLVWSIPSVRPQPLRYVQRYCDRLTQGLDKIYDDWRLPSARELGAIGGVEMSGDHFKFDTDQLFWTSDHFTEPSQVYENQWHRNLIVLVNLATGKTENHVFRSGIPKTNNEVFFLDRTGPVLCLRDSKPPVKAVPTPNKGVRHYLSDGSYYVE